MKKQFPKPTGEYAVGTFTYTIYNDRKEILPAGGMRNIAARVYYPVNKENVVGLPKSEALSPIMIQGFKACFHVAPDFTNNPEANLSECYKDAPRISGKKFPLIMFNHGYNSFREGNSLLCIELVSHGYVIISVAHSYEALCTEFDDGTFNLSDKKNSKLYEPMFAGLIAMFKLVKMKGSDEELARKFDENQKKYCHYMMSRLPEWIKDNEAALDYAKNNLSDLIDFSKGVGATGHSFGGNTAYALCARNQDFVCGINIDGALFGDYTNDIQTKPFMHISCKSNEKAAARAFLRHAKPVYKVLFKDMQHIGFSDSKYTMAGNPAVGKLDADVMHKNLCKCHLEFFDTFLKKQKSEPEISDNEAVKISVYEPDMNMPKHVVVQLYDETWVQNFTEIKNEIQAALGNTALSIEHVGSTSVKGLAAKPIIDIDVVVKNDDVQEAIKLLAGIGYIHEGNLGIEGREAFYYEEKEHLKPHHLYVCPQDSPELKRHIAFRDYLRSHPEKVVEYSQIKLEAAKLYPYNIDKYIQHKSPVIEKIYKEIGLS